MPEPDNSQQVRKNVSFSNPIDEPMGSGDRILGSYPEDYKISFIAMNESTLKLLKTILDGGEKVSLDGYTVRGILEI